MSSLQRYAEWVKTWVYLALSRRMHPKPLSMFLRKNGTAYGLSPRGPFLISSCELNSCITISPSMTDSGQEHVFHLLLSSNYHTRTIDGHTV
jgi:hypothetical protein